MDSIKKADCVKQSALVLVSYSLYKLVRSKIIGIDRLCFSTSVCGASGIFRML